MPPNQPTAHDETDTRPTVLFLGTPEFARVTLEQLLQDAAVRTIGVVTQPDKPSGRGLELLPCPVKAAAISHAIPVFQPVSLKRLRMAEDGRIEVAPETNDSELVRLVAHLAEHARPAVAVVVAYGKLIPEALLKLPQLGVLNIHPSLLPRWRGAAPIQHTIFSGDHETGVCLMRLDQGLDTGPIFATRRVPVTSADTSGSLGERLASEGTALLIESLPRILSGKLEARPQTESGATYAEKWESDDLLIRWEEPAELTVRRVRASAPQPGARTRLGEEAVKVLAAAAVSVPSGARDSAPGTIVESNRSELVVTAGDNSYLSLLELQFPGRKRLPVAEILKGRRFSVGDQFG